MKVDKGPIPKMSAPDATTPPQRADTWRGLRKDAIGGAYALLRIGTEIAQQSGGKLVTRLGGESDAFFPHINYKSRDSALRKAESEFGGRIDLLADIVRITLCYDNLDALYVGVRALFNVVPQEKIIRARDRFATPQKSGYMDATFNVELPNGHYAEIQMHVKPMLEAAEVEHLLYEERRLIEAGIVPDQEGRLAALAGAGAAIFGFAGEAVKRGGDFLDYERDHIYSYLPELP